MTLLLACDGATTQLGWRAHLSLGDNIVWFHLRQLMVPNLSFKSPNFYVKQTHTPGKDTYEGQL